MNTRCWAIALALGGALIFGADCVPLNDSFVCTANDQCLGPAGEQGVCEVDGACTFYDDSCPGSERRYGDTAPAAEKGQCLAVSPGAQCVAQITAGDEHTCVVKTDGSVWCWGANGKGQLGDGTTEVRSEPTRVVGLDGVTIAAVSAGFEHTCAVTDQGALFCWGSNENGRLGVGQTFEALDHSASPLPITGLPQPVASISAGGKHTCAVMEGTKDVYCWGQNDTWQVGVGDGTEGDNEDVLAPGLVMGVGGAAEVVSGDEHTCAMTSDGIYCWGSNAVGQLGLGKDMKPAAGFKGVPPTRLDLLSVVQIAGGDEHNCVLKGGNTVFCWGDDATGEVGDGDNTAQPPYVYDPVQVFHADGDRQAFTAERLVWSGNAFHTCAIEGDEGTLWCWGNNDRGQIGSGSAAPAVRAPEAVKLGTVIDAALGGQHTCAVTRDGAVWCWGDNKDHELGPAAAGDTEPMPLRVPICP